MTHMKTWLQRSKASRQPHALVRDIGRFVVSQGNNLYQGVSIFCPLQFLKRYAVICLYFSFRSTKRES